MYMSLIEHNLFEEIMCTCIKRLEFTTKICMKENNIDSIHAGFVADLYQINIVDRQNDDRYSNDRQKCLF